MGKKTFPVVARTAPREVHGAPGVSTLRRRAARAGALPGIVTGAPAAGTPSVAPPAAVMGSGLRRCGGMTARRMRSGVQKRSVADEAVAMTWSVTPVTPGAGCVVAGPKAPSAAL